MGPLINRGYRPGRYQQKIGDNSTQPYYRVCQTKKRNTLCSALHTKMSSAMFRKSRRTF